MKVVAFLPVKGSSLRIPSKNTKLLDGKPLFLHSLEKLLKCDFIDEVYLDTESEEITELAKFNNHKILHRDPKLASNSTDGNKLFMNEVNSIDADIYIQLLCTAPFININTIKEGIDKLRTSSEYDSCFLTRHEALYKWNDNKCNYDIDNIPNSIDLKKEIIETMGLYIITKDAALKYKRRIGNRPYFLKASTIEAVDVNNPEDFYMANLIQSGLREK